MFTARCHLCSTQVANVCTVDEPLALPALCPGCKELGQWTITERTPDDTARCYAYLPRLPTLKPLTRQQIKDLKDG